MKPVREAGSKESREALVAAARELRQNQTKGERILWNALRDRRFNGLKFRRQSRIGPFIVDFYCAAEELIVEVDGSVHRGQEIQDRQRQEGLEELGLRVLRLTAREVEQDLASVLKEITGAVTPSPSAPLPRRGRGVAEGRGEGGSTPP